MIREYLNNPNVLCGKIFRHELSGNDKSNRIWVYRNDYGEEYLASDKYSCKRKAHKDLRLCRIDLMVEYTANMVLYSFEFSDTFQQHSMTDVLKKLESERRSEDKYKRLFEETCRERDYFKDKLKAIEKLMV